MANATSSKVQNEIQNKDKNQNDTTLRGTIGEVVGGEKLEAWRDRATEGLSTAREKVGEYAEQAKDVAAEYADDVNTYFRRYPIASVLVGFGVGILVGAMVSPRRS